MLELVFAVWLTIVAPGQYVDTGKVVEMTLQDCLATARIENWDNSVNTEFVVCAPKKDPPIAS